ncbi:aminotransferase class V-fold PLP-dependent enzyme [Rheinheimera sp.]|uniref:aminotransferase class V-fold PLP-dependent enzyme n=1 Tax=Rheinheimera sp. TaxID=1869214 RepID=UPI00307DE88C
MTALPNPEIYLDHNATTPVLACAAAAAQYAMQQSFGNPSSSHATGIKAKAQLEQTRQLARELTGAGQGDIIFTSGATEGIQVAVLSALTAARDSTAGQPQLLLYGATEHKAVPQSLEHWNQVLGLNAKIKAIPVNKDGVLDLDFIREQLPRCALICTMAVNNETGVMQDLAALSALIKGGSHPPLWLVDCVQALGKTALQLEQLGVDYAPFSGHKLYAPKGIGFLYKRSGAPYLPLMAGGGQEAGLRSGTENLPGIAALNAVFRQLLNKEQSDFVSSDLLWQYRAHLLAALKTVFPHLVLNSDAPYVVPTTLNFSVPGFASKDILDLFDAAAIRVSAGSACSSKIPSSFVLNAMGLELWRSQGAVRLSFGPAMTEQECLTACERITSLKSVVDSCCLVVSDAQSTDLQPVDGLIQLKHEDLCSYLLVDANAKRLVVIDPVQSLASRIAQLVQGHQLQVCAILDTHLHKDHPSARPELAALLASYCGAEQVDVLGWPQGETRLQMGRYQLRRLPTPGHSPEAVTVLVDEEGVQKFAFTGDLILPGGTGRLDLPGGNAADFVKSLQLLQQQLQPQTLLLSSHDYAQRFFTRWDLILQEQPVLQNLLQQPDCCDSWTEQLSAQHQWLKQQQKHFCGVVEVSASDAKALISPHELQSLLLQQRDLQIWDVRETYEQVAGALEHYIPDHQIEHVPLSCLVQRLSEGQLNNQQSILLVCRSGNRSLLAARVLARAGYQQVYNLKGGVALLT